VEEKLNKPHKARKSRASYRSRGIVEGTTGDEEKSDKLHKARKSRSSYTRGEKVERATRVEEESSELQMSRKNEMELYVQHTSNNLFLTCNRPFFLRSRPHAHLLHLRGPGLHLGDQLLEHLQAFLMFRREGFLHRGRSVQKLEGMLGRIGFEKRENTTSGSRTYPHRNPDSTAFHKVGARDSDSVRMNPQLRVSRIRKPALCCRVLERTCPSCF
jgi:hypothetical protein